MKSPSQLLQGTCNYDKTNSTPFVVSWKRIFQNSTDPRWNTAWQGSFFIVTWESPVSVTFLFVVIHPSLSSHSGPRAEQEQEVGVVVPLQEEVGLGGGAGSDRGGEDGVASARPSCVQTQKILPLRRNKTPLCYTRVYSHTQCKPTVHFYTKEVITCIYSAHTHILKPVLLIPALTDTIRLLMLQLRRMRRWVACSRYSCLPQSILLDAFKR